MKQKNNQPTAAAIPAVIYARYSSHAQRDESIEQQLAACHDYADANNLKVVEEYADRAVSGRSDKRPEFQRMMRNADKGIFQVVVAYKSNRISRNMLQALAYEERLAKLGINVVYVKEEFGNNAAGRFALRTMMNLNQFYSENLSEDVRRGLIDNAMHCKVNGVPSFGYKKGPEGTYIIDEEKAPIVREIFQRIANGEMIASIAADLNNRQIRTTRGGLWNKSSFDSILRNERYLGIYIYAEIRIPGGIPALVSPELFQAANDRREAMRTMVHNRRRRDDMEYLLTGKLFCGYCRKAMVGTSGTGKSGTAYYYYRCQGQGLGHGCHKKPVRKEVAERLVLTALKECVSQDANIQWMTDMVMKYRQKIIDESDLGYLESKLAENKRITANVMKAIEAGVITVTTKARLQELEAEQKQLLSDILREKRAIPDISRDHVEFYLRQFRNGDLDDPTYCRKLIRHFLRAAYLYDDHLDIVFDYSEDGTPVTIPISIPDTPTNEAMDVLINSDLVHQILLIRTPARLIMVGRVFVLSLDFELA